MSTNLAGVQDGMDVLDVTGNKIGTVSDVLQVQAYSQTSPTGSVLDTDAGYGTGPTAEGNIIQVQEGGVLGIGGTTLYVPFSAVQSVQPGQSITLNVTQDQANAQYSQKPAFLDNNS